MNEQTSALVALVNKMPDPDQRGMYCADIDKEKIEGAIAKILKGGRDNIIGVIDMLVEPGKGDDVKAHYALHCMALHVCKLKNDRPRRRFSRTLASQLGGDRPKEVQKYLVRELQIAGGKEVVKALGALLVDEELCEPAAQALAAIGDGAAEQFHSALSKASGKCRLTIMQNLGVVRDVKSADALKKAVSDEDGAVRIAAVWALANIGDADSANVLVRAADQAEGWERTQTTKACLLLAEKLRAAGRKSEAVRIYRHLRDTRSDPAERYVRDAAKIGLAASD
ncbi:MAG: HEAT repeat domain-containing protein [Planctomycetes bacterium]|nr:HEAT repeat domain-containing protein [Planctomycetota bacterium]